MRRWLVPAVIAGVVLIVLAVTVARSVGAGVPPSAPEPEAAQVAVDEAAQPGPELLPPSPDPDARDEPTLPAPPAPTPWRASPGPLTPTPTKPATTSAAKEWTLAIPSLAVRAPLTGSRIVAGEFEVPRDPGRLGVHREGETSLTRALSVRPGAVVVAGHVTMGEQRGALWSLHRIGPGAEIVTEGPGGRRTWRAVKVDIHAATALPEDLAAGTGPERLVLVTCTGPLITENGRRGYRDNLVVTATPA